MIWEKERGWFTTQPFSEPEVFEFPEGIGKIEVVNVEHEEVLLVPRWVKTRRVTFKYGLGDQFIGVLKTLHMLGLDKKEKINVKGVQVAPRDVVAASCPIRLTWAIRCSVRPVPDLGEGQEGWQGERGLSLSGSRQRRVHEAPGRQAVVAQTAFNAVIAWDLIQHGQWKGVGVLGPESFDPVPFMGKMADYGFRMGSSRLSRG